MRQRIMSAVLFLLSAVLLICGCAPSAIGSHLQRATFPSESSENTDSQLYEGNFGYDSLHSDESTSVYELIDHAASCPYETSVSFYGKADNVPLGRIINAYRLDRPEIFWLGTSFTTTQYSDRCELKPSFYFEGDDLEERKRNFDKAVEKALAGAPETDSAYEKEIYVNNYLIDNCEYNYNAAEDFDNEAYNMAHTAYGALVEGSAVCDGYSKAFQLLCERLGVTCVTVQGTAKDMMTGNEGLHMWNGVKLGGEWYYTDVTWNDSDEYSFLESSRYYYFNITTAQTQTEHEIYPEYSDSDGDNNKRNIFVPKCKSTTYNYLLRELPILDSTQTGFAQDIADTAANGEDYFEFIVSDDIDFDETFSELTDGGIIGNRILEANRLNSNEPELNTSCRVYSYKKRRIISIELNRL